MSFACELSRRALNIRFSDLPEAAIHVSRRAIADTIGVALAGRYAPALTAVEKVLNIQSIPDGVRTATLWGCGGRKATVLNAALINGMAAHVLDFDDCSTTMGGHPSAPVIPAVIALAEANSFTAGAVIEAYLAGYETETRLARGLLPHHYEKGWHPTATLGVFGATVAAARLLKLDEERLATALSIAVSLAAGLKSNFGTPIKPLHVGQSAHNGILAALLSQRGTTANLEAFEHTYGFFNLFNGKGTYDVNAILENWDGQMEVLEPGISIKQHPCCGSTHSAIDAALKIVSQHGVLDPDAILKIETSTHERRLAHTNRAYPNSGLDAKFSVQFLTIKALIAGKIRLSDFDDATFLSPEVERLLPQITSSGHSLPDAYYGEVRVTMKNGQLLQASASTNFGRGNKNPMSDDELKEKFLDCAVPQLETVAATELFDRILHLEKDDIFDPILMLVAGRSND